MHDARPALSVCCLTRDPPQRVAAVLRLLREVADEIVVAVDARLDEESLGAYEGVADDLVRYRFRPPVDRARAWLHLRCSGAWLLWIDGDEVPSPDLVSALPGLLAATDVAQFAFPRRWVWPDTTSYLGQDPWEPDYQIRLVRNEPRSSWWRPGLHGGVLPVEPRRHVEAPLYHLDLAVSPLVERRAKVRRYDADPTTPEVVGFGDSFNEVLYLPEVSATVAPLPVPEADRAWLDAVLAAGAGPTGAPPRRRVPFAPEREVEQAFPGRVLPDTAYAARLTPLYHDRRIGPGETHPVYVRVENLGTETWPGGWEREPLIRLSYHLRSPDGRLLEEEGRRTALPAPLAPGEATVVPLEVDAPQGEGQYVVEADVVHEFRRWFDCGTPVPVLVAPRGTPARPELDLPPAPAVEKEEKAEPAAEEAEPAPEPARVAPPAMHGCTIIARNYTAQAEVLASTFREHHPASGFTVLVVDDPQAPQPEHGGYRVLHLSDLDAPLDDLLFRAALYDVVEFCTSVKSLLLQRVLVDSPVAVYLDPDIEILAPLDDIAELATSAGVVVTPHTSAPIPQDGALPDDRVILAAGVFNLGFIAVSRAAADFLHWWEERLRRGAFNDVTRMRFTDQRWIDFLPCMRDVAVLRDPGCNVAYWNLDARPLSESDGRLLAGGAPLRFFHFSGYDPAYPWLLSKYGGSRPRVLLSESPLLARLCARYARALESHGAASWSTVPYGFRDLPSGLPLDGWVRQVLRRGLEQAEDEREVPNPFDPRDGGTAFARWLLDPVPETPASPLARCVLAVWEARPDLQAAWPDPHGADAGALLDWVEREAGAQAGMGQELVREVVTAGRVRLLAGRGARPGVRPPGVNLVGYLRGGFSLGTTSRALAAAVASAGEPVSRLVRTAAAQRRGELQVPERGADGLPHDGLYHDGLPHDVTLLCVNADMTTQTVRDLGALDPASTHVVGLWWWELEEPPPSLPAAYRDVDEVWVGSAFVHSALAPGAPVPVVHMPVPVVPVAPDPGVTCADLGVPEQRAHVLTVFDHASVMERKNPLGALEAFRRAFPRPGGGPVLVLKTINGQDHLVDRERLRLAVGDDPDVLLVEDHLAPPELARLVADAACVLSLHRSEGLGLVIGEALAFGRPVVATDYSGTREFVSAETGFPVPFQRARVPAGCAPYRAGAWWAEPDLDAAAAMLRQVWEQPHEALRRGDRGRQLVSSRFCPGVVAEAVSRRLAEIRAER